MAPPRPRKERWRYPGALLSPTPPCSPPLPSRGQSAVEFLLEGSCILGCPRRTPSTARPLPAGLRALIGLPLSVWMGACYWHGVGRSMFHSSSSATEVGNIGYKTSSVSYFGYFKHIRNKNDGICYYLIT